MDKWEGAKLNEAKEILAYELTKLVHGEEEAEKAKEASHALFAGGGASAHMPTVEVTADDLYNDKLDIMAVLVKDVRTTPSHTYTLDDFAGEGKVVKRGKKKFAKVISK